MVGGCFLGGRGDGEKNELGRGGDSSTNESPLPAPAQKLPNIDGVRQK